MKYLVYNDVSYLFSKKRLMLIAMILLPILIILLYAQMPIIDTMMVAVGANVALENIDIIQLLMYLFNIFSFVYLATDIYIKDFNASLENIFLRMTPLKYIVQKNLLFTMLMIIVKILQYSMMSIYFLLLGKRLMIAEIIELLLTDTIYILLLQYSFLFIYLFYILCKKNILVLFSNIIVLLLVFPKTIMFFENYKGYVSVTILFIHIIIDILIRKKAKIVMENV